MWHEKVTIGEETDRSNNFTRIPLGVYDLEPRVKILKFQNVALNSIEPGDVQDLHRLIINVSNIEALGPNIFRQSPDLEGILIVHSKVREIQKDAFEGLEKLRLLHLTHNPLQTVSQSMFEHLNSLEVLHLNHCGLKTIPAMMFEPFTKMRFIQLESNDLDSFNSTALGVSPSLEVLILARNKISSLDLTNAPKLTTLLVLENELTALSCDMISCGEQLIRIDASSNRISSVDPKLFERNPNLSLKMKNNTCHVHEKNPEDSTQTILAEFADEMLKDCYANF